MPSSRRDEIFIEPRLKLFLRSVGAQYAGEAAVHFATTELLLNLARGTINIRLLAEP